MSVINWHVFCCTIYFNTWKITSHFVAIHFTLSTRNEQYKLEKGLLSKTRYIIKPISPKIKHYHEYISRLNKNYLCV